MSLILTLDSNNREPIEAGNHVARCVQVIDLGTQIEKAYESEETQLNHKIRITWELPNESVEWTDKETGEVKTRPAFISQEFKASLHEKSKLRKTLMSWRGKDFTDQELKGFALKNVLSAACFLNIVHTEKDGKKYANISAVTPMGKGMQCPDMVSDLVYFEVNNFDQEIFEKLPKFIQEKILNCEELKSDSTFETKELIPLISEAQLKFFHTLCGKYAELFGITLEEVKSILKTQFKFESSKDLNVNTLQDIVSSLQEEMADKLSEIQNSEPFFEEIKPATPI